MNLDAFTDKELEDALKQRRNNRAKASQQFVVLNVEELLAVHPNHDRTSCTDADMNNRFRCRCTRCMLLFVRENGYTPDGEDDIYTFTSYFTWSAGNE